MIREPTIAEVQVEQAVLGLLLDSAEGAWAVLDRIEPADMLEPVHQRIVDTVRRVLDEGGAPSALTIAAAMSADPALEKLGGVDYFQHLRKRQNVDIAPQLCAALADQARRRALGAEIAETESRLIDNAVSADDILADHQASIQALAEGRARPDDPISWYDAGAAILERLERPDGDRPALLPYGMPAMDAALGGMGDGDLIILAGRPAMGKSALAVVIGYAVARPQEQIRLDFAETKPPKPGAGVLMFSLEMKEDALLERGLSMRARQKGYQIPYQRIRLNRTDNAAHEVIAKILAEDTNVPFLIDKRRRLTVAQIGVRARRVQAKFRRQGIRLGLIIIDHLGLIEPKGDYRGNKVAEVTENTKDLKGLAGTLDLPILCLSQLSRKVEERDDKRPHLADLRESGSIEQDADQVLLLYRPEYYLAKSPPPESTGDEKELKKRTLWEQAMDRAKNRLEIHAAKNRHGPETVINANCELQYNHIWERANG